MGQQRPILETIILVHGLPSWHRKLAAYKLLQYHATMCAIRELCQVLNSEKVPLAAS